MIQPNYAALFVIFFSFISLYIVIALPTIAIEIVVAFKGDSDKFPFTLRNEKGNSWKSDNYRRAIQKRNHESNYKTNTKNEAKRLRGTTIAIAKLDEQ